MDPSVCYADADGHRRRRSFAAMIQALDNWNVMLLHQWDSFILRPHMGEIIVLRDCF